MKRRAIVIGDSTHNTLSVVRSLGEAKIEQVLILKCENDVCYVCKSKYLRHSDIYRISRIEECLDVLQRLKDIEGQTIICSFDEAAMFVDANEPYLSEYFRTPARGKQIGKLFNKDEQCKLAEECGLTVPQSRLFSRKDGAGSLDNIEYPALIKPLYSTEGEKSDIHICKNKEEIEQALKEQSHCEEFILQQFIDKEFELDCIGVRTEKGMFLPGGVKKIRHYPPLIGAGAYGLFQEVDAFGVDKKALERFLEKSHYYGPFSVEFLHKGGENYFMEVNFRNEGLAYAATKAGANLHALYMNPGLSFESVKMRQVYMMNYSLDFLYVKNGDISLWTWLRDFFRTRCFINISFSDLSPVLSYYKTKFKSVFAR